MFFERHKIKKERKAKKNRLSVLELMYKDFKNLLECKYWTGALMDVDGDIYNINVWLESLAEKYRNLAYEILNCKGFRETEAPYEQKIPCRQLKLTDGKVRTYIDSDKTITIKNLRENQEQFRKKFGPDYSEWKEINENNIETANIYWPGYTYLVHLRQDELPRMEASFRKIFRNIEMEMFKLKRELGEPGYRY